MISGLCSNIWGDVCEAALVCELGVQLGVAGTPPDESPLAPVPRLSRVQPGGPAFSLPPRCDILGFVLYPFRSW